MMQDKENGTLAGWVVFFLHSSETTVSQNKQVVCAFWRFQTSLFALFIVYLDIGKREKQSFLQKVHEDNASGLQGVFAWLYEQTAYSAEGL